MLLGFQHYIPNGNDNIQIISYQAIQMNIYIQHMMYTQIIKLVKRL